MSEELPPDLRLDAVFAFLEEAEHAIRQAKERVEEVLRDLRIAGVGSAYPSPSSVSIPPGATLECPTPSTNEAPTRSEP
jgi:hypothetical protein